MEAENPSPFGVSMFGLGPGPVIIDTSTLASTSTGNTIGSLFTARPSQPDILTSSVVSSTPGTQTTSSAVLSSSVPSSTPTSSSSTTLPVSSNPTRSSGFGSLQLGPIVGGVVAAFVLISIIIFLLLKLRALQRENRLRAEIDPVLAPFNRDLDDTREELDRNLNFNDYGSEMPRQTVQVRSSQVISPENVALKRDNHTVHYLIANGASEDMTHLTNNSTESDYDPPAYDSLSSRNSHLNSISSSPDLEPSRLPG